jgi:hypothetical protein
VAERSELAEGQEVRVFDGFRSTPGDGHVGTIVSVGRKLVGIRWRNSGNPVSFRIDSQRFNGESYGAGTWFKTMDQVALSNREQEALETLRQYGLGPLGWGGPKASLQTLEAAAWMVKGAAVAQKLWKPDGTPADPATVAALFAKANDRPIQNG